MIFLIVASFIFKKQAVFLIDNNMIKPQDQMHLDMSVVTYAFNWIVRMSSWSGLRFDGLCKTLLPDMFLKQTKDIDIFCFLLFCSD